MYQPIKFSPKSLAAMMETFSLDPMSKPGNIFTEAVFKNGKEIMKPIEEQFQVIKDLLDAELAKDQSKDETKFNPGKFVKNLAWKELENRIIKIFGFRNVDILHWNEKYNSGDETFESLELNCHTYTTWRYPIDGLVSDNGFYDTTKSINTQISYSLGIIKELSAGELVATFLHELGHNLDPAIVDINYTKTNILSKYLTDRAGKINPQEQKMIDKSKGGKLSFLYEIVAIIYGALTIAALISIIIDYIKSFFKSSEPEFDKEKLIQKVRDAVKQDKDIFNRQHNYEAFADNFARMYGYGPELISGFSKTTKYYDKKLSSRYEKEQERQKIIATIIMSSLKSTHKTDVHRGYNLIREYEADLKDPNIPAKVKDAIRQDLEELNKIMDDYLNSGDEFSQQLNKMILEEIKKIDTSSKQESSDDNKNDKASLTTESVLFAECIEPYDEKMALVDERTLRHLNDKEALLAKKIFGNVRCTFMKDKNGYFVINGRARTGFYDRIEDIPKEKVMFVCNIDRTRHYNR